VSEAVCYKCVSVVVVGVSGICPVFRCGLGRKPTYPEGEKDLTRSDDVTDGKGTCGEFGVREGPAKRASPFIGPFDWGRRRCSCGR